MKTMKRKDLDTEKQNENSSNIDKLTSIQILKLINSEDSSITKKIAEALEDIESVVEICIQSIRSFMSRKYSL